MLNLIIVLISVIFIKVLIEKRLIIRFDTIFRKGFKRFNDKVFGVYTWIGKQRRPVKHIVCAIGFQKFVKKVKKLLPMFIVII